ncbi:MAG: hypothetical protein ACM3NQ_21000, partial [Bacteroidales bacterium]
GEPLDRVIRRRISPAPHHSGIGRFGYVHFHTPPTRAAGRWQFLARFLGGRYQETMTPEVATRLKEITVDPKTVTLTKPSEPASAAGLSPRTRAAISRRVTF